MIVALALSAAHAAPNTYILDPTRSQLFVIVRNDRSTVGSSLGHDHAIAPRTFDGTVTWDPADLSACQVAIAFPVTALYPDPPGLRVRAGLDPDGVGEGSLNQIRKNLQKPSQLDVGKHPTIRYRSTRCASRDDGRVDVTGELTIRGVGLTVTVPMEIEAETGRFEALGRFEAKHTDFGFEPFSNMLGALRNDDRLEFVVDVRGG